ncbi:helix-turn-helix domain-containing protein [Neobacillus drentensis]|uniref:helix-turn-helix domain-containing protein n=1 Tax=Neobacillus drentensis TaxID=220684 RepID=UPI001F231858|nr:helix-turn-helix domain-containing protein [Neobacillus drentensis]ULT56216.1 helix-turn-helix domain-containing protein [Neobacillus drentensis]
MIGDRIKKLRERKGYSITELAELAGVSKSYLSYMERNLQNNPSLQFLSKIAASLDTTIPFLLGTDGFKSHPCIDHQLDEEWRTLIQKAINEGMSKEDFKNYRDYLLFTKWQNHKKNFRE